MASTFITKSLNPPITDSEHNVGDMHIDSNGTLRIWGGIKWTEASEMDKPLVLTTRPKVTQSRKKRVISL